VPVVDGDIDVVEGAHQGCGARRDERGPSVWWELAQSSRLR
jgi:hypothetical protein